MTITVAARFCIEEGHEREKVDLLRRYATEGVITEPGTLCWDIYKAHYKRCYFCIEEFVDDAAMQAHGANCTRYFVEDPISGDTGALQGIGDDVGECIIALRDTAGDAQLRADKVVTVLTRFSINKSHQGSQLTFLEDFALWIADNEPGTLRWDVFRAREPGIYFCIKVFANLAAMGAHAEVSAARFDSAPPEAQQAEMLGQDCQLCFWQRLGLTKTPAGSFNRQHRCSVITQLL